MTGRLQSRTAKLSLLAAAVFGCPLYADNWFSNAAEYAAITKTAEGQVSVERDMHLQALVQGDKLKMQETVVTGKDGRARFQVSDGSTIEVFPNSKFIFRKTPGNYRDLLDLVLGRVRVQIEHIGTTPNPNKVRTPTAVISVRGTIFDIDVNKDDESTLVTVEEGVVDVGHALLGSISKRKLHAGESIRVYRDTPVVQRIDKNNLLRQVMRIGLEAAAVIARGPAGSMGGIGGGGIGPVPGVGDTDGTGGVGGTGGGTPAPPPPPSIPLPSSTGLPSLP